MEPTIGIEPTTCALLVEMVGLAPTSRNSTLSYIPKCAALPLSHVGITRHSYKGNVKLLEPK